MKVRIQFFIAALLVLLGGYYLATSDHASFKPTVAYASVFGAADTGKYAQIKTDEDAYDFHNIIFGDDATHTFIVRNVGNDTLKITSARASCGCTTPQMKNVILPGDTAHLTVTYHSKLKGLGSIIKTISIQSNSRTEPLKIVRISGVVIESKETHRDKAMMHIDGIFEGDCAKCHVDKGKGELGARLFDADCGICHGDKADGKTAPDLASDRMMDHSPKDWKHIIENGIAKSNMPAFHKKNKGPLGDEEIASVLEYLKAYKKELQRQKAEQSTAQPASHQAATTTSANKKS